MAHAFEGMGHLGAYCIRCGEHRSAKVHDFAAEHIKSTTELGSGDPAGFRAEGHKQLRKYHV